MGQSTELIYSSTTILQDGTFSRSGTEVPVDRTTCRKTHTSSKWQRGHENQIALDQNYILNHHMVLQTHIPGVGQPDTPCVASSTHSPSPEHSHRGKNPRSGHQTANNMLRAPFTSKVMSFLSTLRVSLSFSWQKRLPNYSSYQTAAVSRLILTGSAYIMHTQGTKNPWKNNFSWKLKDPTSTWGFHFLSLKQRFY